MSDMFGINDFWSFVGAVLIFLALPGPGTFCLLASTARNGLAGGYASLLGLILGDQVLMWMAVAGVAAVLQAHPLLFNGLQYLGAAYLVYLGIRLIWPGRNQDAPPIPFANARDFKRGLLVTLVNPKAIGFYMAFLPLFIDPATHPGLPTFAAMAATIALCTLIYCTVLIFVGNVMSQRLREMPRVTLFAGRIAGIFLIAFGVKLTIN